MVKFGLKTNTQTHAYQLRNFSSTRYYFQTSVHYKFFFVNIKVELSHLFIEKIVSQNSQQNGF